MWNSVTAGKFVIQTASTSNGYESKICFFEQKFTVTDVVKAESRRKVAIVAMKELFGISLSHWHLPVRETSNNAQASREIELKKFEKARLEAIKEYYNRAKGNLEREVI